MKKTVRMIALAAALGVALMPSAQAGAINCVVSCDGGGGGSYSAPSFSKCCALIADVCGAGGGSATYSTAPPPTGAVLSCSTGIT